MRQPILHRLLMARFRTVRNQMARIQQESLFKILIVAGLGAGFWGILFLLFDESFYFLNANAYLFKDLLVERLLSLFFLTLLLMLAFSNALLSFSNLFRAPETAFLHSLPVRLDTIFLYKMLESLVFSSWAFFVLGLPLLLAYGRQNSAPWSYYPALVAFMVPFVMIPAGVGSFLGLTLTAAVPRHRGKILAVLGILVMLGFAWAFVDLVRLRNQADPSESHAMRGYAQLILGKLNFTQHPLTPNFWMTQGLMTLCQGGARAWATAADFLLALCSTAVFLWTLGWFLSGSLYAGTYSDAAAASRGRRSSRRWFLESLLAPLQRRHPYVMVLVIKDLKTFFRDPLQWAQVLIFFGLLTVYIANIRNFGYRVESLFYQNLISFLNLGATSLTLATMVSRFVFPLVSLEGQRFWVLGLVPVRRGRILAAKFVFSLAGALLTTEFLVVLSNWTLGGETLMLGIQALTAALICIALTGLAVGMGALFPNLREPNPSKIVSGFGGTLTLILSISIVLVVVAFEGLLCHRYLVMDSGLVPGTEAAAEFKRAMLCFLAGTAAFTLLAAYLPLRLGARALEKMEF